MWIAVFMFSAGAYHGLHIRQKAVYFFTGVAERPCPQSCKMAAALMRFSWPSIRPLSVVF